jgi:hypothetical protein
MFQSLPAVKIVQANACVTVSLAVGFVGVLYVSVFSLFTTHDVLKRECFRPFLPYDY